ncbi:MAG: beta-L-arabinofuranosidase domain-containing protein [Verrucomicrobiota bacterium]
MRIGTTDVMMAFAAMTLAAVHAAEKLPVPEKVACAIADMQAFQQPDLVHLTGWMGTRIDASEKNRLVKIDTDRLLRSYRNRPSGSYDGEHIGKWLHAATLAWVNTGDAELRKKLDYTAAELAKCQLEDGYLGTYAKDHRWTEWDVWAHKYNLIGLLTYYQFTGNEAALNACRKMGDLLIATFPKEKSILDAGDIANDANMSTMSVLEPVVLLYRLTGEKRYLDFARYIVNSWDEPHGPAIIKSLLTVKQVNKIATGKAYQLLSVLVGVCDLARVTGDREMLQAALNAWQDIVDKRLYITGASSYIEVFHEEFDLPNLHDVGENCVTVTWIQFNAQLLRLTGEARFAEQLERVLLNQLLGAQKPDGTAWAYYTQMEGKKPYTSSLDGQCCLSSGPRGLALIPTFAASVDADGVVMNLYDAGTAKLTLRNGKSVVLTTDTNYPSDGKIVIAVDTTSAAAFAIKLRIPAWCRESTVMVNGKAVQVDTGKDGYAAIKRTWAKGDKVELNFKLEPRVIVGDHMNEGKVAVMYGPLVLAADEALLGTRGLPLSDISLSTDLAALALAPEPAPEAMKSWPHAQVFHVNAISRGKPKDIRLVPFADAGSLGGSYKVWLFRLDVQRPARE